MKRDLPRYEIRINLNDDETGIKKVSLVESPATQVEWMMFNKENYYEFKTQSAEKRIIVAPVVLADTDIYRRDETGYEYYITFSPEDIENGVKKFFLNKNLYKNNIEHSKNYDINGLTLIESWIVDDPANDKSASLGFKNITKGTWMGTYWITDEKLWEETIKTGVVKGLSIEGLFGLEEIIEDDRINEALNKLSDDELDKLLDIIKK